MVVLTKYGTLITTSCYLTCTSNSCQKGAIRATSHTTLTKFGRVNCLIQVTPFSEPSTPLMVVHVSILWQHLAFKEASVVQVLEIYTSKPRIYIDIFSLLLTFYKSTLTVPACVAGTVLQARSCMLHVQSTTGVMSIATMQEVLHLGRLN